jgi:hypothetical protein
MTDKTEDAAWAVKEAEKGEEQACDISYQLYAIASLFGRDCGDDDEEAMFKGLERLILRIHDQAEKTLEHFEGLRHFAQRIGRDGGAE